MTDYSSIGQKFNQPISAALSARGRQIGSDEQAIKELAYKAFVVCHDQKILVEAWLPEQVSNDVNANYEAPFAQGIGGDGTTANVLKLAGLSLATQALSIQVWQGGSYINFSLPFIFQAEESGADDVMRPIKDLLTLMVPQDPSNGGLLEAPGPRLDPTKAMTLDTVTKIAGGVYDGVTGGVAGLNTMFNSSQGINGQALGATAKNTLNTALKPISSAIVNSVVNNISLYIGQFQYFPSVVVTDVSPTYDVVLGPDKNPVRASVNVAFRTFYIPTRNDIELMFPSAPSTTTGTYGGTSATPNSSAASRS